MATKEEEKGIKERNKVRIEKLAGFFYDLAKLSFAALVLGIVAPLVSDSVSIATWVIIICGVTLTISMAMIANRILK